MSRYRECTIAHCCRTALFRDVRDGVQQKKPKPMNSHSPYSVWTDKSAHVLLFLSYVAVQLYLRCCLPPSFRHLLVRNENRWNVARGSGEKINRIAQVAKRSSRVVKVYVENDSVARRQGNGTENRRKMKYPIYIVRLALAHNFMIFIEFQLAVERSSVKASWILLHCRRKNKTVHSNKWYSRNRACVREPVAH